MLPLLQYVKRLLLYLALLLHQLCRIIDTQIYMAHRWSRDSYPHPVTPIIQKNSGIVLPVSQNWHNKTDWNRRHIYFVSLHLENMSYIVILTIFSSSNNSSLIVHYVLVINNIRGTPIQVFHYSIVGLDTFFCTCSNELVK